MVIDLKIVSALKRITEIYINKRNQQLQKKEEKKWINLFKGEDKVLHKLEEEIEIFLYKDSILSKLIYSGFEDNEIKFLIKYLNDSDIFIDIGSNIGLYAICAAMKLGPNGKVIAFEPTPATFKRLLENVQINNFEERIIAKNIGLSDNRGIMKLNSFADGYDAWNTFALPSERFKGERIEVFVDTLDLFLEKSNLPTEKISLIKIDVEGWETFVIKGAKKILTPDNSPVLLVEFTEDYTFAAGTNCYELYDLIKSYGYELYTYKSETNELIPEPKRIHYPYNNLIAIKNFEKVYDRITK
jgi:FkbM family methyltransferase